MKKTFIIALSLAFATLSTANLAVAKNNKEDKLPPGLQKKADRGQSLPPGWQKKLHVGDVLEQEAYDRGEIIATDKKGLVTLRVEGRLVRFIQDTKEIVEILQN